MAATPKPSKIDALTGIRGVAALWVVSLHLGGEFSALVPGFHEVQWITGKGFYGVDVFFILSGFILSYTYQESIPRMDRVSYLRFIWFRFARIYPAYLAALLVAVALVGLAIVFKLHWNRESYRPLQLLYEFFMVHQWTFQPNGGWNYPDWSVSAEWFAYLFIFPLTYFILKRLRWVGGVMLLLVATLGIYAFTPIHEPSQGSWGLFQVTLEFMAGAALYRLYTFSSALGVGFQNLVSVIIMGVMLGMLWLGLGTGPQRLLFLLGVSGMLLLLANQGGIFSVLLGSGVFVYLGEISYSIYLTHGVDQRILKDLFPVDRFAFFPVFQRLGIFIIYIGTVIGGAALLYHLVEVPARNRLRRWGASRACPTVPVAVQEKQI